MKKFANLKKIIHNKLSTLVSLFSMMITWQGNYLLLIANYEYPPSNQYTYNNKKIICSYLDVRVIAVRYNSVPLKREVHFACKCSEQQRSLAPRSIDLTPVYRSARQPTQTEVVYCAEVAMPTVPDVESSVEHIGLLQPVQLWLSIG